VHFVHSGQCAVDSGQCWLPAVPHYDAGVARRVCVGCVVLAVLAAGCSRSSGSESAPAACTDGSPSARVASLRAALTHAPAPVRLPDGTSISDCLAQDADSGDIQNVGSMLLTVTQQLVDSGRGPRVLVELGYLAGAVHHGASRAQGVDNEIERRIQQELGAVDTGSPAFRRGERAGRASG
jgi:hypothetical protein